MKRSLYRQRVRQLSLWTGFWSAIGPVGRMVFGIIIILATGWLGMRVISTTSLKLPWPYAAYWAAIGWSRLGIKAAPLLALFVFGLAQDWAAFAPLGLHSLIYIGAFAFSCFLFRNSEFEHSAGMQISIPALVVIVCFFVYWLAASIVVGGLVDMFPILASALMTVGLYYFFEVFFDLEDPLA